MGSPLFLGKLSLGTLQLRVHLDLLAPLGNGELQLLVAILQTKHLVRLGRKRLPQPPHVQLHDVVGNLRLLAALDSGGKLGLARAGLKTELCQRAVEGGQVRFERLPAALHPPLLVRQLLQLRLQLRLEGFRCAEVQVEVGDARLEPLALLVAHLALDTGELAFHGLDLELGRVQQLCLPRCVGIELAHLG